MVPDLKPCPRCKSVDKLEIYTRRTIFGLEMWMVDCLRWDCYGTEYVKSSSRERAIKKWNKRCDKLNARGWHEVEIE